MSKKILCFSSISISLICSYLLWSQCTHNHIKSLLYCVTKFFGLICLFLVWEAIYVLKFCIAQFVIFIIFNLIRITLYYYHTYSSVKYKYQIRIQYITGTISWIFLKGSILLHCFVSFFFSFGKTNKHFCNKVNKHLYFHVLSLDQISQCYNSAIST